MHHRTAPCQEKLPTSGGLPRDGSVPSPDGPAPDERTPQVERQTLSGERPKEWFVLLDVGFPTIPRLLGSGAPMAGNGIAWKGWPQPW